jgi:hypothetical protein
MRQVIRVVLLVVAGVIGPLLSIPIWISLWESGQWVGSDLAILAWFLLPAAITGVVGSPIALRRPVYVAVTSATSGSVGCCLTFVTFVAYGSAALN